MTLLPGRESATVQTWLSAHPGTEVVSSDRVCYGEAIARALPLTTQVADRWHPMENASTAFLDAVRKSFQAIRAVIGAPVFDPELLSRRLPRERPCSRTIMVVMAVSSTNTSRAGWSRIRLLSPVIQSRRAAATLTCARC